MDLVGEIERFVDLLSDATDRNEAYAMAAADADVVYKQAFGRACISAKGGDAGARRADADLKSLDEYKAKRLADAFLGANTEKCRSIRAQLSAMQSLANFWKSQS